MNKTYIKPSSVRIAIFTEGDVADVNFMGASGNQVQSNRKEQPSNEWTDDFDDEDFAE